MVFTKCILMLQNIHKIITTPSCINSITLPKIDHPKERHVHSYNATSIPGMPRPSKGRHVSPDVHADLLMMP